MPRLESFLKTISLILFSLLFLFIPNSFAATIHVPGDYATIQAAIDAAVSGDTVMVGANTYHENVTLADGVTLQSKSGATSTVIDADGSGSVVTMASNSTIDGFTIQNGTGTVYDDDGDDVRSGGGIYCVSKTNVTIQNCIIQNNTVDTIGGVDAADSAAMYGDGMTNGTISNCTIDNNTSSDIGGVSLNGAWTVTDCTFSNNTADADEAEGGALYLGGDELITISRCIFYNNSASFGGGGIFAEDLTAGYTITNCLFYSNTAGEGGGIKTGTDEETSTATITNCTFANNTGQGLFVHSAEGEAFTLTVRNCIFYGNSTYGIYENAAESDATPINCLFYNNKSGAFYDEGSDTYSVEQLSAIAGAIDNIDNDPRFIDSDNNNYHLQALSLGYSHDSPCIDTGKQGIGAPTNDLDGNPRPQGSEADIGCYEASSTATRLANLTKAANRNRATYGDIVTYSLIIKNTSTENMVNTTIQDTLPKGLKYIKGTAKLDNSKLSDPTSIRRTKGFSLGTLLANTIYTLKYKIVIGAGSSYGRATNRATLTSQATDLSPTAEETITIIPNPLFNASTIIGKVFQDSNQNGYQDKGELGLSDITLITEDGFMVTTDTHGRYHIDGLKPQTKVIAVMTKTLPKGYTLTTPNPVLLKLTPALTLKANFGVFIPKE